MSEFNSKEYGWGNYSIGMNGRDMIGIRGLKFKTPQEKDYLRGKSNNPIAITSGNISPEGSLKILQSEYQALESVAIAAGYSSITGPAWTIVANYEPKAGQVGSRITKTLIGCEIEDNEEGFDQGDQFMEIDLPFKFLRVQIG